MSLHGALLQQARPVTDEPVERMRSVCAPPASCAPPHTHPPTAAWWRRSEHHWLSTETSDVQELCSSLDITPDTYILFLQMDKRKCFDHRSEEPRLVTTTTFTLQGTKCLFIQPLVQVGYFDSQSLSQFKFKHLRNCAERPSNTCHDTRLPPCGQWVYRLGNED